MKPFFCTDITEDKENDTLNGECFRTTTTDEGQLELYQQAAESQEEKTKEASLPLPLQIVMVIAALAAMIPLTILLTSAEGGSLAEAIDRFPWVLPVALPCLVIFIGLIIASAVRKKRVLSADEAQHINSRLHSVTESIYMSNGVSGDAIPVDILMFDYVVKNGEPVVASFLGETTYINIEMRAFQRNGFFCLASIDGVWEFPTAKLRRIRTVNKRISLFSWNKETPFNKEPYKKFSIRSDENQKLYVKPYHVLELEHEGETYGIYFPAYELPFFVRLTGLSPE